MFRKKKNDSPITVFGTVRFVNGWQSTEKCEISLWGNKYYVYICATAIDKNQLIVSEQENAFNIFSKSSKDFSHVIETVLSEHFSQLSQEDMIERFTPDEILFARDGSFGICIGDKENQDCAIQPDADIAIQLYPSVVFYKSQEEYLSFLD